MKAYDYIKEIRLLSSHLIIERLDTIITIPHKGKLKNKRAWKIKTILRYNRKLMVRAKCFLKPGRAENCTYKTVPRRRLPGTNRDTWNSVPHVVLRFSQWYRKDKVSLLDLPEKGENPQFSIQQLSLFLHRTYPQGRVFHQNSANHVRSPFFSFPLA